MGFCYFVVQSRFVLALMACAGAVQIKAQVKGHHRRGYVKTKA